MDFNKEIKKINEVKTEVMLTIPVKEADAAYNKALAKVGKEAKLKGFRPGKAPKSMIEKMYGGRTRLQVIDDLAKQAINGVMSELERSEDIMTQPKVDFISVAPEKPIEMKVEFSFFPRPEIKGYDKIEVEMPPKPEAGKDEVDRALRGLADSKANIQPITDRKKAKKADIVIGELFEKQAEGDNAGEYGSGEKINVPIGEKFLPEELEKVIIGMEIGSEVEATVNFPEDHQNQQLAGRTIDYKFLLNELSSRQLPEINDAFAKELKFQDTETLLELRQKISELVEKENSRGWEDSKKTKVVEAIVAANQFDIPEIMMEREIQGLIAQSKQGEEVTTEDIENASEDLKEIALGRVQAGIVLMQLAKQESIMATREDMQAHIADMAAQHGMEAQMLEQIYMQNPETAAQLQSEMTIGKVYDFLEDKVSVKTIEAKEKKKTKAKKTTKKSKKKDE